MGLDDTIKPVVMPLWPDAAMRLGLTRSAAYRAAAKGDIPAHKVGHRWLVNRQAFAEKFGTAE